LSPITTTTLGTSSTSTSTAGTSSTTTTTHGTTAYVPPQTDTTIPYVVTHRETIPPEPSTPEHEHETYNGIFPPENNGDYEEPDNIIPDPPMPEPETEPPPIFRTPPPYNVQPPVYRDTPTRSPPKKQHPGRINTEAEERTAMIIGIVAGALIAVILVILLVLWIKSNGDRSYKMEHDLKYGHGANAALLGNSGHSNSHHGAAHHAGNGSGAAHHGNAGGGHHSSNNQHQGQQQQQQQQQQQPYGNGYNNGASQNYDAHMNSGHANNSNNGSLRQHGGGNQQAGPVQGGGIKAKRNSKDIKEWYV